MFYIYEWYNIDTNEVFYVGKGCYNRYKVKKRNKKFNEYIKNNKCDVRIIEHYENELMCFKKEEELLNYYKSINQCQCNLDFGGNGGVKIYWTKEMKEKMSKNNPMKSIEQRERMSKNNPMKNKDIAEKVALKLRKPFKINGKVFNCLKEASQYYAVTESTISDWKKHGKTSSGEKVEEIKQRTIKTPINKEKCYINFRNKKYSSIRELSEKENIPYKTIENWLKKGFSSKGEYIRYSNDKKEYKYVKPYKAHSSIPIIVNGKKYNSKVDASNDLGISVYIITHLLKNNYKCNKYKEKYNLICKYVNQQPSLDLKGQERLND